MHHIAELNVARMRYSLDDPRMQRFVEWLDPVNGLADESPGFVWRLQTEAGNSTAIRAFDDERILVNLSVWESLDALREFVLHPNHMAVMRERSDWFERMDGPHLVLWWVPAGHRPSAEEARKKLEMLAKLGPTREAFTFGKAFPVPNSAATEE